LYDILKDQVSDLVDFPAQVQVGLLLIASAAALRLNFWQENMQVPGLIALALVGLCAFGVVLAFTERFSGMVTVTCAIVASIVIVILGVAKGWLLFRIPELVRDRLGLLKRQCKNAFQRLIGLFPGVFSHRIVRTVLLIAVFAVLIGCFILLRDQIRGVFGAVVSWALAIHQRAKQHEDQIVFTTLGLASFAVLLAILITIVYERYARRLTAIVLAIAFLALVALFCLYPGPEIVKEAVRTVYVVVTVISRPALTPTETPTSTPIETPTCTPTGMRVPVPAFTSTPARPTPTPVLPTRPTPEEPSPMPIDTTPTEPTKAPSATPTNTPLIRPTNTPLTSSTDTPTVTPTNTPLISPTDTPTVTLTSTPHTEPTNTPHTEPTNTPLTEPTNTPLPRPTNTPLTEPINTPLPRPTNTPLG
jgi:hypothetical protein